MAPVKRLDRLVGGLLGGFSGKIRHHDDAEIVIGIDDDFRQIHAVGAIMGEHRPARPIEFHHAPAERILALFRRPRAGTGQFGDGDP